MHTDRCGNTCRQEFRTKGNGKEAKIQEFMYRDTVNVESEMLDSASNYWSHWSINKMFKEKFGSHTRKHSVHSLQKTTILETSHIMLTVLQSET
jgi:hypothetical protein